MKNTLNRHRYHNSKHTRNLEFEKTKNQNLEYSYKICHSSSG